MYSLKNIKYMIKNNFGMTMILIICLFISFEVMFFSIGVLYQYQKNIEDGEIDSYAIGFAVNGDITKKDLNEFIKNISSEMLGDISYITCFSSTEVSGIEGETQTAFYIQYNNQGFEYSNNVFDPMIDDLFIMNGRFFSQDEFSSGSAKAVVMGKGNEFQPALSPEFSDTVTAFGKAYDVIGVINPSNSDYNFYSIYVPFDSIPDDTVLNDSVYFALNKKITQSQYNSFVDEINNYFSDKALIYDIDMDLESNYSYYISVMIISVGIAVLSALNISIVYNYIIIRRRRQLNIMRIYGGTRLRLTFSAANEIMIQMIPIGALSVIIYDKIIVSMLTDNFPLIKYAYNLKVYAEIIIVYCVLSYFINLFLLSKSLNKFNWRV